MLGHGTHGSAMLAGESKTSTKAGFPAFGLGCWLLGLVVLAQIWVAGMALAVRLKEAQEVRVVEKEVIKPMVVEVPAQPAAVAKVPPLRPLSLPPLVDSGNADLPPPVVDVPKLAPSPVRTPPVADPRTERLLMDGRDARVAGDMGKAIVKLEQALQQTPDEPNAVYELGLIHEQMGVYDRASEYYEQVFRMGLGRAGALYEIAADKLRDGFQQPTDMLGKLSLGRVRIFKNPNHEEGEQVILTIPVQKGPGTEIELDGIQVEVRFFGRTGRGDIVELNDPSWAESRWVSLPFDWAGGEEQLRMTYTIPKMDPETEQLFGTRRYYGQVVTLDYDGEVMDVQAWPRDLAAKIEKAPETGFGDWLPPEFQDTLPPDFDPSFPILPTR